MTVSEIRRKYLAFFQERGHVVVPSSSLVPENDPTTLFTGSGMQPMISYLLGEPHPQGGRIVDSQKCFRAEDIEEVGDNRHTTFFEMLGNWSLGSYFKKEQIPWMFTFLTQEIGLDPNRLYVTVFSGDTDNGIPEDPESVSIWKDCFAQKGIEAEYALIGSEEEGYQKGMGEARIFGYGAKKNWWSRAGVPENMPVGEPGGPDSEMFYDFGKKHDPTWGEHCHPNCDCGRFMEIGNNVFMEFIKEANGVFASLPQKNVDFGGGLERLAAAVNDRSDVFLIDVFVPLIEKLEKLSGTSYTNVSHTQAYRIVVDHIRGAVFMISEGLVPGNTDQGYVLRRLLRRAVRYADSLSVPSGKLSELVSSVVSVYEDHYPQLREKQDSIEQEIAREEEKFRETLSKGMREFEKFATNGREISGHDAFILFSTYGFPLEMTVELATERGMHVDEETYTKEFAEHQKRSQTAAAGKFAGGLADHSAKTTMLHTVTHLMLAGLRNELGDHIHQAGSNITAERTRFDFTHPEKVSRKVLDRVEEYVNNAIAKGARVEIIPMDKKEAQAQGVEGSFWEKYPDRVNVYVVKDNEGVVYSQELCGGPHVENTGDITGVFKITKEQSSSAGVRRVKATLCETEE